MSYAPRILVVEDDGIVRQFLETVLGQDGYYITAVATGRHALRIVREMHFEVVLVDMSLPDWDGPNLIREILSDLPHLKTLAMSGAMGASMRGLAIQAGADAICQKPVTPEELRRHVYRLLDPSLSWARKA